MENLETGKDKIKKICEILKSETIEPARDEAQQILDVARQEALQVIRDAKGEAEEILQKAKEDVKKQRELFENGLKHSFRQSLEMLRQSIENKLFNESLSEWVEKQTVDPAMDAKLINVLVEAIEKEGMSAEFSALIPAKIPAEQVNAKLVQMTLDKLKEHSVVIGNFASGIQLRLHDKRLTLDLSDEALKELISQYVRKDFRKILFQA